MSDHHLTDKIFADLDLPGPLLQGVREAGFERCTPIQAEALPLALAGQDVAGQAQTGTGKTAAFLLAAFSHLQKHPAENRQPTQPRALMLAPTRELAVQIHKDAEVLGKHAGFKLGLVYGGTGYDSQRKMLEEGVDILIGTPGRIIDYFKQHVFNLNAVQVMVLDEADRMFDLGFIKDIRFLLRRMPEPTRRLSMLFSATLSYRVTELAYEHMNNPQFVSIEPDKRTAEKVTQVLYHTAIEEKLPLLLYLLRHMDSIRSLVFTNTKDMAENIAAMLKGNEINAAVLSGDVPQNLRLRILLDFTEGRLPVLVATDVAARGLHIPDVSHVFNYDLPQNAEDYVHRIGRTARAGASGDAVSFACERFVFGLPDIEAYIGYKIPTAPVLPEMLPQLAPSAKREYHARAGADRGRGGRPERGRGRGREPRRPDREHRRDPQAMTAEPPRQEPRPVEAAPPPAAPPRPAAVSKQPIKPVPRRNGGEKPIIG
ncbi:MAG: ATP-dependent RNA helicase RhlB [Sulfuricaulis sp.]